MEKPTVKIIGENGNVFNVIGLCSKALKKAGMLEEAKKFKSRAINSSSYDEVLRLAMDYCEVE